MKKVVIVILIVFLFSVITLAAIYHQPLTSSNGSPVTTQTTTPPSVTLVAAGDIIMHTPIVKSAYNQVTKTYNFDPIFTEVKDIFSAADFATAVLETPLEAPGREYTGYPTFNAPGSITDSLKKIGIDLVFTAHNHSIDKGIPGITSTVNYLNQIDLPQTGLRVNESDPRYYFKSINGINLAFFSYTTSTNGIRVPPGKEWMLNTLNYNNIDLLAEEIKKVKAAGADAVILALHTGTEYQRIPSAEQHQTINKLIEIGVDIILGSHVHVIQPYEFREYTDSNGNKRRCFIAYSLGNFLSNQQWRYSDCGLILTLKLVKDPAKPGIIIDEISHLPIWVNRYLADGKYQYRLLKVTGPSYSGNDPAMTPEKRRQYTEVWNDTQQLLQSWQNQSR